MKPAAAIVPDFQENVRKKLAEQSASVMVAKAIVELSEDLGDSVNLIAGQVICSEIDEALDALAHAKTQIEANSDKNPRAYILRMIGKISNRLTIVSAAYRAGVPRAKP